MNVISIRISISSFSENSEQKYRNLVTNSISHLVQKHKNPSVTKKSFVLILGVMQSLHYKKSNTQKNKEI